MGQLYWVNDEDSTCGGHNAENRPTLKIHSHHADVKNQESNAQNVPWVP